MVILIFHKSHALNLQHTVISKELFHLEITSWGLAKGTNVLDMAKHLFIYLQQHHSRTINATQYTAQRQRDLQFTSPVFLLFFFLTGQAWHSLCVMKWRSISLSERRLSLIYERRNKLHFEQINIKYCAERNTAQTKSNSAKQCFLTLYYNSCYSLSLLHSDAKLLPSPLYWNWTELNSSNSSTKCEL